MLKQLIETAIQSALNQDWPKAIEINLQILKESPNHIPTLNRLGNAYFSNGEIQKAIETYQTVIKLDKYNNIAQKNLQKLAHCPEANVQQREINLNFLEEPGKTKTVPLARLAEPATLARLRAGEIVKLVPKKRLICVQNNQNEHIGVLTDDVAFHLRKFIEAGYEYVATIKRITQNDIKLFIKEIHRTEKLNFAPTFPE